MSSIADVLRAARARLGGAGLDSAALDARVLLAHVLGVTHERLVGWPEREVVPAALAAFSALVDRRADREPVAYLVGSKEFWGLRFAVSPATLIPRPDTETIVEAGLSSVASRDAAVTILDIGTGTGCILISLLRELPNARGIGVDVVPAVLALASENALSLGVATRAQWFLDRDLTSPPQPVDLVVANLPYVPRGEMLSLVRDVAAFEPHLALDGGVDGFAIFRLVAPRLAKLLRPGAMALFEVGHDQAAAVQAVLAAQPGLMPDRSWVDLAGVKRVVGVRRIPG